MDEKEILKDLKKLNDQVLESLQDFEGHGVLKKYPDLKTGCGQVLGNIFFLVQDMYEKNPKLYEEFKSTWLSYEDLKEL